MFNLIGLGLNAESMTIEAVETLKKCDEIYLESYTVDFPYDLKELEKTMGKKVEQLSRGEVEDEKILEGAEKKNIALLVYGDALSATTHIHLILACKKKKIPYKIIHSESILTAIAETGLSLYKFGKTASIPSWKEHKTEPTSFADIIKQNQSIKAHTLLLTDIGLSAEEALGQLEKTNLKLDKLIICSRLGAGESRIYYDKLENLKKKKIEVPFCIIIPSELHFVEEDGLRVLSI